jgi:hypothetical protein
VQQPDVFDLFFQVAGFAAAGKAAEPRTAGAERPGRNRNLKLFYLVYNRLNVHSFSGQQFSDVLKLKSVVGFVLVVVFLDFVVVDHWLRCLA